MAWCFFPPNVTKENGLAEKDYFFDMQGVVSFLDASTHWRASVKDELMKCQVRVPPPPPPHTHSYKRLPRARARPPSHAFVILTRPPAQDGRRKRRCPTAALDERSDDEGSEPCEAGFYEDGSEPSAHPSNCMLALPPSAVDCIYTHCSLQVRERDVNIPRTSALCTPHLTPTLSVHDVQIQAHLNLSVAHPRWCWCIRDRWRSECSFPVCFPPTQGSHRMQPSTLHESLSRLWRCPMPEASFCKVSASLPRSQAEHAQTHKRTQK